MDRMSEWDCKPVTSDQHKDLLTVSKEVFGGGDMESLNKSMKSSLSDSRTVGVSL